MRDDNKWANDTERARIILTKKTAEKWITKLRKENKNIIYKLIELKKVED